MKCIVCSKEVNQQIEPTDPDEWVNPLYKDWDTKYPERGIWDNGVVELIYPGYGSKFDTDILRICVCDDCLEKRIADESVQKTGSYM